MCITVPKMQVEKSNTRLELPRSAWLTASRFDVIEANRYVANVNHWVSSVHILRVERDREEIGIARLHLSREYER